MSISRNIATPLTIGSFAIMSVTGVLMFFHADSGLNKLVHEWAGWAMVAGAALHVIVNWAPFKRYFSAGNAGVAIIALSLVVLAGSFWPVGRDGGGLPPPVLAMKAVANAPMKSVAPLTGKPVETLLEDLRKAGIALGGADASISSATRGDRGLEAKALQVLFGKV